MEVESRLRSLAERVERALERWLADADTDPSELHRAMRYAVFAGGKRVRPALVYATGQALECNAARLDGIACAVEVLHVYSLIHDDLPAMDDDELRRGKPSCHRAFGEATAILAGDAMQALAFHILAHDPAMTADPGRRLRMVAALAQAAGSRGMAGGQAIDLAAVGKSLSLSELEDMHLYKTGALIRAGVRMAALDHRDIDDDALARLDRFARGIGLAFQIRDDILDVEAETATLGKTQGADVARGKPTYPAVLGMGKAKARADQLLEEALAQIAPFGQQADTLREIATYIVSRPK